MQQEDDFGMQHYTDDEDPTKASKKSSNSKYTKQSKAAYILNHVISPLLNFLCFLLFWCVSKDWASNHAN